jgi:pimeloyl-ACP methyl ester carboxylesterase
MSEELRAQPAPASTEPDWSDRAVAIDHIVEDARPYAARSRPFDEQAVRDLATRVVDRTVNLASSMTNHWVIDGGADWRERVGHLCAPTLVIHGAEDPLFPNGHALALANEIPSAELLPLEQTGHELPRATWYVVVPAILKHTSTAGSGG